MVSDDMNSDLSKNEKEANVSAMLNHTLEHFRAIVQGSDDAIVSKTLDSIVTSWNLGAQKIFGYTEEEMVGKSITILIPPDRIAEEAYFVRKIVAGERIDHFETERLHKDGHRINVSVTLSPIRDRDGRIIGASKIARDITRTLRLHAANEVATNILQSTEDAIISKTLGGIVTSWNPGAERLFGYTSAEMIGQNVNILFAPDRHGEEQLILERIAKGDHVNHFETVRLRKDGSLVDVSVSVSPVRDTWGRIIGASKIARDITERKRADELVRALTNELELRVDMRTYELVNANVALQKLNLELQQTQGELMRREKMSALGSLVAGVSHEMNTPLGNSLTVGSTLHHELVTFENEVECGKVTKHRLKEFNQNLHCGLDLLLKNLDRAIEQIRHFKQVSVDQASEQRRVFDLKLITEDNVAMLLPQFRPTPHDVVANIPDDIKMDSFPGAIGQVITNLALNALVHGFADDMQGVVSISAGMIDRTHVQILVADNGRGISKETLPRIFDPFFTTKMGQGGSGLGLNIVFNLVTLTLNGSISVESTVGTGTCFTIVLPLVAH